MGETFYLSKWDRVRDEDSAHAAAVASAQRADRFDKATLDTGAGDVSLQDIILEIAALRRRVRNLEADRG